MVRLCSSTVLLLWLLPVAAIATEMPISVMVHTSRTTLEFKVLTAEGKHLAEDFPAKVMVRTSPETELEQTIELQGRVADLLTGVSIELPVLRPLVVDVELQLGVCDAAGTCAKLHVGWQVEAKRRPNASFQQVELLAVQAIERQQRLLQQARDVDGMPFRKWYQDDLARVLGEAEDKAEPALLVFKTRWCPPCNQLWTDVLHNPRYAVDLAPFVKGVFDADLPVSWEAKSRFQVGGYPTLVVCTPDGNVVWRQEGYEDAESLIAELDRILLDVVPLDEMVSAVEASADPGMMLALADRYRHARDREAAARWIAQIPPEAAVNPLVAVHVRAYLALSDDDAARGAAALEEILVGQALDPVVLPLEQASWWYDLVRLWRKAEQDARGSEREDADAIVAAATEKIPLALERMRATAEHVLASQPSTAQAAEAYSTHAVAARELGGDVASAASWSAAADLYLEMAGTPVDEQVVAKQRGHLMEAIYCLTAADRVEEALALTDVALRADPGEAVFYYLRARASKGREAAALLDAAAAYEHASGDLRLRAAAVYSDLLEGAGRTDEAAALLNETLADLGLPVDEQIRTHRYAGALRERLARLTGSESP